MHWETVNTEVHHMEYCPDAYCDIDAWLRTFRGKQIQVTHQRQSYYQRKQVVSCGAVLYSKQMSYQGSTHTCINIAVSPQLA